MSILGKILKGSNSCSCEKVDGVELQDLDRKEDKESQCCSSGNENNSNSDCYLSKAENDSIKDCCSSGSEDYHNVDCCSNSINDSNKECCLAENVDSSSLNITIKVLGTGCKNCQTLTDNIYEALKRMNISAEVIKVTDLGEIAGYGIISTPAMVVNEKVVSYGKVLKASEIIKVLEKVVL